LTKSFSAVGHLLARLHHQLEDFSWVYSSVVVPEELLNILSSSASKTNWLNIEVFAIFSARKHHHAGIGHVEEGQQLISLSANG
jgi:hypothetical protein